MNPIKTLLINRRSISDEIEKLTETLTEQRKALQASEERCRRIFDASPLCFIIVDSAGAIVDVNAEFLLLMGKERPDWVGKSISDLSLVQGAKLQPEIQTLLEQGLPIKRRKGSVSFPEKGSSCFFNFSGVPLLDGDKKRTGAILIAEEITREQILETQLIQSQKMETVGALAGGLAHDFNNILTGVLGYASLLKLKIPPEDPNYAAVEVIEKSSLRARDLVQQLTGFARRTAPTQSTVDVNGLIAEIVLLFEKSVERGVSIRTDLDPALPKIIADSSQIHQALMNLCINAKDAIPSAGGLIFIKTCRRSVPSRSDGGSPEERVEIAIRDTGKGIEPEVLPRIFEPFFTTKEAGKGTGLGLAVAYGIVKQHGGELSVESEPGKGTTFTVQLLKISNRS